MVVAVRASAVGRRMSPPSVVAPADQLLTPMANRKPKALNVLYATLALALCVLPPLLMADCKLDTTPIWGGRTPLDQDDDAGDE